MSMLSAQADALRDKAERLRQLANGQVNQGFPARNELFNCAIVMREAAGTITALRDKLQEVQGVSGESNYSKLFGTPERAARTLSAMQKCELGIIGNCDECDMHDACRVRDGDYAALLEWLRGEGADE